MKTLNNNTKKAQAFINAYNRSDIYSLNQAYGKPSTAKTTSTRKQREEREILSYNIRLALSKFTAIMMGEPDKYKTPNGYINYYPSDCLNDWSWSMINKDGQKAKDTTNHYGEVAGIICKGRRHWNDEPQEITVMFKDL